MRRIKVFSMGLCDFEEIVNTFLESTNAVPISVNVLDRHDLYYDGSVNNQWQEVILIYEESEWAVYMNAQSVAMKVV